MAEGVGLKIEDYEPFFSFFYSMSFVSKGLKLKVKIKTLKIFPSGRLIKFMQIFGCVKNKI